MKKTKYTQGDLCGTCGPYVVVNAISNLFPQITYLQSQELYYNALTSLHDVPSCIVFGTLRYDMRKMLKEAKEFVKDEFDKDLIIHTPYRKEKPKDVKQFFETCKSLGSKRTSTIIGVSQPADHWTMIHAIYPTRVKITCSGIFHEKNEMSYNSFDVVKNNKNKITIDPSSTYVLTYK